MCYANFLFPALYGNEWAELQQQVSQVLILTELGEVCKISALCIKNWETSGAGKNEDRLKRNAEPRLAALNLRN